MKLIIDMNLSPEWVDVFARHGWQAIHWSTIGEPGALDRVILTWARENGYVVFTHDLDFGSILATTQADSPSVIQIRAQDVAPKSLESVMVAILHQHQAELEQGALIIVNENKSRVRILPLRR